MILSLSVGFCALVSFVSALPGESSRVNFEGLPVAKDQYWVSGNRYQFKYKWNSDPKDVKEIEFSLDKKGSIRNYQFVAPVVNGPDGDGWYQVDAGLPLKLETDEYTLKIKGNWIGLDRAESKPFRIVHYKEAMENGHQPTSTPTEEGDNEQPIATGITDTFPSSTPAVSSPSSASHVLSVTPVIPPNYPNYGDYVPPVVATTTTSCSTSTSAVATSTIELPIPSSDPSNDGYHKPSYGEPSDPSQQDPSVPHVPVPAPGEEVPSGPSPGNDTAPIDPIPDPSDPSNGDDSGSPDTGVVIPPPPPQIGTETPSPSEPSYGNPTQPQDSPVVPHPAVSIPNSEDATDSSTDGSIMPPPIPGSSSDPSIPVPAPSSTKPLKKCKPRY